MTYLIGYDIGSSSIKASIIRADSQEVMGVVQYPSTEMDIISAQRGWAEQNPEDWWRNLCLATKRLLTLCSVQPKDIKGIGIAYQMHGLVLVDKNLQVLRPSIIWCDSRAVAIGEQVFLDLGQEYCLGNLLNSPGNFTASKLKWVKGNEPELYDNIHSILLPGEYIAMKLTGVCSTTISGLSEGIFWNFKEKRIDERLLNYYELNSSILPVVSATFSDIGSVTKIAAEQTGLAAGTPVTYRAGDQPNNAAALNVLNVGEVAATAGTSGVVYGIVDKPLYDLQSRVNAFAHINYSTVEERIGMLLCINGAGIQYSWIKHQIGSGNTSYQEMERMAASVPIGSEGVCILPFGNGAERIFNNRNIGAHIANLDFNRHTQAHLYRASLEGVAFAFARGINLLTDLGMEINVLRVGNDNLFQSQVFSSTISTLLQIPIEVVNTTGAVGAARLAGIGCGIYGSLEEALSGIVPDRVIEPHYDHETYSQAYATWQTVLNRKLSYMEERDTNSSSIADEEGSSKEPNSLKQYAPELLVDKLNLLNNRFVQRLQKKFPSLTYDELKLCFLLKANFSTTEMSARLNLSQRGVETRRYRLRKKLAVPAGQNLVHYIATI